MPSTCPSFCGVGPIAVFLEGVKSFLIIEGDSYGSISHGCIGAFDGVWKRLEG
jgi:hypothetical protein